MEPLYAGDPNAPAEYARLVERVKVRFPDWSQPHVLRHALALQPAARIAIEKRRTTQGADVISAAEILLHLKDPKTADLLAASAKKAPNSKWVLRYLSLVPAKQHRRFFEKHIAHEDPEMRFFALAGLAQLGDAAARIKVAEALSLSPHSVVRYHAGIHVPRMEVPELIRAWEGATPDKASDTEKSVHAFALKQLKALSP